MATKAEQDHMNLVAAMPCVVPGCKGRPQLHHCININHKTRDHFRVIPLCEEHHTGTACSIHKTRKTFRRLYGHEDDMVIAINNEIGGRE